MKRVIALSDSHGDKAALRAAVEQALRVGPIYAAAGFRTLPPYSRF